jgi:hypothetical protein
MENARKTKMVLEVVPRRCKSKPLWNPKTRTMTQVHSQHKMSTRMRYTWRGRRRVYAMNGEAFLGGVTNGGRFWDGVLVRSNSWF